MTPQIDFNALAVEIHEIAKAHGFWENENHAEKIALMHSELAEALESWRNHEEAFYTELVNPKLVDTKSGKLLDGVLKPSGWAVELIDCAIRILDWFGYLVNELPDIATNWEGWRNVINKHKERNIMEKKLINAIAKGIQGIDFGEMEIPIYICDGHTVEIPKITISRKELRHHGSENNVK